MSQGYVYVLDSEGAAREGWPVQMGDVQGQVAVADIDSDGRMCAPCPPCSRNVAAHLCDGSVTSGTCMLHVRALPFLLAPCGTGK